MTEAPRAGHGDCVGSRRSGCRPSNCQDRAQPTNFESASPTLVPCATDVATQLADLLHACSWKGFWCIKGAQIEKTQQLTSIMVSALGPRLFAARRPRGRP